MLRISNDSILTSIALIASLGSVSLSQASNYPADYTHQVVRVLHQDAVLFAHVGSGAGSAQVVGYKNSGVLARTRPDKLEAVVESACNTPQGSRVTRRTTLSLGREWRGTGYMSAPFNLSDLYPRECLSSAREDLAFAFSDGNGNWDSKFGANYRFGERSLWDVNVAQSFETHESGPNNSATINEKAWNYITEQMRK